MGVWEYLFGDPKNPKSSGGGRASFRSVDWHAVEGRWSALEQMANGSDQSQKKQALIQADMLIDDILKQATVAGSSMGERLKALTPTLSKASLDGLWEAHKKRNELVHEHGSFMADWELQSHLSAFRMAISELRGKQ